MPLPQAQSAHGEAGGASLSLELSRHTGWPNPAPAWADLMTVAHGEVGSAPAEDASLPRAQPAHGEAG
jgi:hypothetical protein